MANNGDIADVMLKTLFEFVGWVFKMLIKLIGWIFTGLFSMISKASSKKEEKSSENVSENIINEDESEDDEVYSYADAIRYVENAKEENSNKEQLEDRYFYLFVNTVLNGKMSVDEKCSVLELLNKKLKDFFRGDVSSYFRFLLNSISASYKMLEKMYGENSAMVSDAYNAFNADVKKKLQNFNTYLSEIFGFAGLLYSPDGKFSIEDKTLLKYDLPTFEILKEDGKLIV